MLAISSTNGRDARTITPTDAGDSGVPIGLLLALTYSAEFFKPVDGFYIGGTGDLKITSKDGTVTTVQTIPAGFVLPFGARKVWSTGTTATKIVGFISQ